MAMSSIKSTRRTINPSMCVNHSLSSSSPGLPSWLGGAIVAMVYQRHLVYQTNVVFAAAPQRRYRMRFGLFHNLHDLTKQRDYADLLDELRELAAICDETDFDILWMPEHHFSVWGRELLPNPMMTAVDLAARTKRIRIGIAAAIVTFWHPLRAAEDIALLDQLTGGRV